MDLTRLTLFVLAAACLLNLVLLMRILARYRAADMAREAGGQHGGDPLEIGSEAPDFMARTLAGQPMSNQRLAGRAVAFVFLSPTCDHCRDTLPVLNEIGPLAGRAGVQVVIVTDTGPLRTRTWLDTVFEEDGVRVQLPVLVAPPSRSMMAFDYNPPGVLPYFCLVGADGLIAARGTVNGPDWTAQVETWRAPDAVRS